MFEGLFDQYKDRDSHRHISANTIDPAMNKVYLVLQQMQRSHSFLEIMIEGDDAIYQSMILSLDPDENTLLIDELFPTEFLGLVGQRVHVSIRQKAGRRIQFQSVILERHSEDNVPLYVLKMPAFLDLNQRRGAFRLPINTDLSIPSRFTTSDSQNYNGKLRNVSCSGLCIEVDSDKRFEPLHYDDYLSHVTFDFAGQAINCDMVVRSVEADDDSDTELNGRYSWFIGAEFVDLPMIEQRTLERSIMRIQRDRAKYADDMTAQQSI